MYNLYGSDLTFKMLCEQMIEFGYYDESDLKEDIIDILLEQGFINFMRCDNGITTKIEFIVLAKANVLEKHLSESIIHIYNII